MFSGLFGLVGQPEQGIAGAQEQQPKAPGEPSTGHAAPTRSNAAGALGVDIWGLANAVTSSVAVQAGELVKSVAQTDWKAELMAFSKEAAEETKHISHRTAELVEHLPEVAEHLPAKVRGEAEHVAEQVANTAPDLSSTITHVGGSIRTFGATIFAGTKELIEQVVDAVEGEMAAVALENRTKGRGARASTSGSVTKLAALAAAGGKYSRLEEEVAAMQRDSATYCDAPEDSAEFSAWRSGFSLDGSRPAIATLLADNAFMAELHAQLVPAVVEEDDFWARYFYRLSKLQAKAEARHALAQRALAQHDTEDALGWDDLDTPAGPRSPVKPISSRLTASGQQPQAPVPDPAPASPISEPVSANQAPQPAPVVAAATVDVAAHVGEAPGAEAERDTTIGADGQVTPQAAAQGPPTGPSQLGIPGSAEPEKQAVDVPAPSSHSAVAAAPAHPPGTGGAKDTPSTCAAPRQASDAGSLAHSGVSEQGDAVSDASRDWLVVSGAASSAARGDGSSGGHSPPGSKTTSTPTSADAAARAAEAAPTTASASAGVGGAFSGQGAQPVVASPPQAAVSGTAMPPAGTAKLTPTPAVQEEEEDDVDLDALAASLTPKPSGQRPEGEDDEAWGDWD